MPDKSLPSNKSKKLPESAVGDDTILALKMADLHTGCANVST